MSAEIVIRRASVGELMAAAEWDALVGEYAGECSIAEIGVARPVPNSYEALEQTGMFHLLGVWRVAELVGFGSFVAAAPPHYNGTLVAFVESLFVADAARDTGAGGKLMEALLVEARAQGCEALQYVAPVGSRLSRLLFLCADEYRHTNNVFWRSLN